jgi:DNA-binding response OmpR family regulator
MSPRVLIVDDEPSIVLSLEFLLQRAGYEVAVAADGEAALRAMEAGPPDLVVLDVMMPRLDGFEVCRRIRADPRWRDVKVLILSAKGRDVDLAKGLGVGADAYVTKPFATKELVARVGALLRRDG